MMEWKMIALVIGLIMFIIIFVIGSFLTAFMAFGDVYDPIFRDIEEEMKKIEELENKEMKKE